MAGQSAEHMAAIAPLGAAARWATGPTDDTDEGVKSRARAAVKRAIDTGRLVRPSSCSRCGAAERFGLDGRSLIHGHHYLGYDHPLDVEWLCIDCHFIDDPRPQREENGRAKIGIEAAREIRRRHNPGWHRHRGGNSARALAKEFGIDDRTVRRILKNEIWIDAALSERI